MADRAPAGVRLFGRIDHFHCECPTCGAILQGRLGRGGAYNPITAELRCPRCDTLYGVGLLLWRRRKVRKPAGAIEPVDQIPTAAQRAQLRQYQLAIWTEAQTRAGDPLNVDVTDPCTCPMETGGRDPFCPVHGWAHR